jgi:hypothetical protein
MDDSFRQPAVLFHDTEIVKAGNQQNFPDLFSHQLVENLKAKIQVVRDMVGFDDHLWRPLFCIPRINYRNKSSGCKKSRNRSRVQDSRFKGSGFSAAAGLKNGQSNRKRN